MFVVFMELFAAFISSAVRVVFEAANWYSFSEELARYAPASPAKVAVKTGVFPPSLSGGGTRVVSFGTAKMMYQGSGWPASPWLYTANWVKGIGFGSAPQSAGAQAALGSNTDTLGSRICPKAQMDSATINSGKIVKVSLMILPTRCY